MKKIFLITTLVVLFFVPFNASAAVVINEVYYDPLGTDTGKEYIILYNNGDSVVDLTGWDLDPSDAKYFTFPAFSLNAKSFVTIHINVLGINTNTDLYDGGSSNMSNTKGPIALFNSTTHSITTIVDYIEYGAGGQTNESKAVSAGIWTAGAFIPDVSEGKAIKLKIDGVDNNSPSDWIETEPSIIEEEFEEPTPEKPETPLIPFGNNPPIANAGDNIIAFIGQEINFDGTKSSDPDNDELAYSWNMGDGKLIEEPNFTYKYLYPGTYLVTLMVYDSQYYVSDTITVKIQSQQIIINEFIPNPEGKDEENEWIELYNDSDSIVDISGWQLDDMEGGSKPFAFPQNTLIAPKSYIVFSRQITKIALNNDKDSVRLLLPVGVVFQEVQYEKPKEGMSSARTDQGFVWSVPTPGTANIVSIAQAIGGQEGEISYQYEPQKQTVKEYSKEYTIEYSPPEQKIEGGYTFLTEPEQEVKQEESSFVPLSGAIEDKDKSQLATVKESILKQNPINLILLIIAIILGALVIGLSVIKFRKKFP